LDLFEGVSAEGFRRITSRFPEEGLATAVGDEDQWQRSARILRKRVRL
jgi:hypothetical protein